jgi:formylglycine-generating enzyme required for sulfatase activity
MGSPEAEAGRAGNESGHEVTIALAFEILRTEVTREAFEQRMGYAPGVVTPCNGRCPVQGVSWHEAAAYCNYLSAEAGLEYCYECRGSPPEILCQSSAFFLAPSSCPGYRLPTEAEWELAARAGTATATYNGDLDASFLSCSPPSPTLDPIAWYCGNSSAGALEAQVHPVAMLGPSASGLYDVLGNVGEWCHDACLGTPGGPCGDYPPEPAVDPSGPTPTWLGVVRGGSFSDPPPSVRAAARAVSDSAESAAWVGFRPVRTLPR